MATDLTLEQRVAEVREIVAKATDLSTVPHYMDQTWARTNKLEKAGPPLVSHTPALCDALEALTANLRAAVVDNVALRAEVAELRGWRDGYRAEIKAAMERLRASDSPRAPAPYDQASEVDRLRERNRKIVDAVMAGKPTGWVKDEHEA